MKPLFDAAGARILASGYPFGQHDVVRSARTTKLLSGEEWVASLRRAREAAPQNRPAP